MEEAFRELSSTSEDEVTAAKKERIAKEVIDKKKVAISFSALFLKRNAQTGICFSRPSASNFFLYTHFS